MQENDYIYDLTEIFTQGLSAPAKSSEFLEFSEFFWDQIRESQNITCDPDVQGANWYLVYDHSQKQEIAFISRYYPVALVCKACPASFLELLEHHGIYSTPMREKFSCDGEVLKQYAPDKMILDDSSVNDEDFLLNHEWIDYISERLERRRTYVTPYEFTFQEIR